MLIDWLCLPNLARFSGICQPRYSRHCRRDYLYRRQKTVRLSRLRRYFSTHFLWFLAVLGTFYLQAHELHFSLLLPAFGCGLLSVAVLNINNLRDIEQDKQAGKNTLIVRIGSQNGRIYHVALLSLALLSYLLFALANFSDWYNFLFLLATPLLVKHGLFVYRHQHPTELRPILGQMAGIALVTNILFSLSVIL